MAHLVFICHGNICRSPIAERVARHVIAEQGLDHTVESFGLSGEEAGNPIDERAQRVLIGAGYDADHHRARKVGPADLSEVDLVVATEPYQVEQLRRMNPEADVALLNDFNPAMPKGTPLEDPWYGGMEGFNSTLADVEAAMPGIIEKISGGL